MCSSDLFPSHDNYPQIQPHSQQQIQLNLPPHNLPQIQPHSQQQIQLNLPPHNLPQIQRYLEDQLADIVLEGKLEAGDTILMELVDETKEIKARIVKPIVALNE